MVADFVAFAIDALRNVGEFLGLYADKKESGRSVFALENVENRGRPLRVRAVVEG